MPIIVPLKDAAAAGCAGAAGGWLGAVAGAMPMPITVALRAAGPVGRWLGGLLTMVASGAAKPTCVACVLGGCTCVEPAPGGST
jgi:hypothetical protein